MFDALTLSIVIMITSYVLEFGIWFMTNFVMAILVSNILYIDEIVIAKCETHVQFQEHRHHRIAEASDHPRSEEKEARLQRHIVP